MTAKEKAKQIYELFLLTDVAFQLDSEVKQCVMICVDEIINNSRSSIPILIPSNELVCSEDYWQEVKKETEQL